jgi:cytoskeletal protein RodZ
MSFGSVIRNRRTALGISLNDLAERLEISPVNRPGFAGGCFT